MQFKPLDQMWQRLEVAREESDRALFYDLLLAGEMITKLLVVGLAAAIEEDLDQHRYRILHRLVRASGIGDWADTLSQIIQGPASEHLARAARVEQQELIQKFPRSGSQWQVEAIRLLHDCLVRKAPDTEELPGKVSGRLWFTSFAHLRNKTRGHGATTGRYCKEVCPNLEKSIRLIAENCSLFGREWACLHRNLSGKYRITKLTQEAPSFDPLKSRKDISLPNGVYVQLDTWKQVQLLVSDADASDFYLPNGAFTQSNYELISYYSDSTRRQPSEPFLVPATDLPRSHTAALTRLETQGKCFGNLPHQPNDYVKREGLERETAQLLLDDRHPIITLAGRGGIGKTSLALSILHEIAQQETFDVIIWFSSRDVDLLDTGAKLVRPDVFQIPDIAEQCAKLAEPPESKQKDFDKTGYLADSLRAGIAGPTLFVFDNFETTANPIELYSWLDNYIRLPNKILITTRTRDFRGDYPVEVSGMELSEFEALADLLASRLNIGHLITQSYRTELYEETEGHPYVVRIILGEVAKAKTKKNVRRIVAGRSDVLEALFERTYASLAPASNRAFLTLCRWRSPVPVLALEATLLRSTQETIDVESAVSELERYSLIERVSGGEGPRCQDSCRLE